MSASPPPSRPGSAPLDERDIDALQSELERIPQPLEPLDDVSMLDGFLCGLLLQRRPVPSAEWLPRVIDVGGRPPPRGVDVRPLQSLVLRRHAELEAAIAGRQWFDPWVFDHEPGADEAPSEDEDVSGWVADAVYPWAVGFATAMELFPRLMDAQDPKLTEPLALIFQFLPADDLEDADALLAEIEMLEPPSDLGEAVEMLVRATLLLADIGRPLSAAGPVDKRPARPRAGGGGRGSPRRAGGRSGT